MCNWQWLYNPIAPFKAMDKGLNLKDDKAERRQREAMARSQALQNALNKKTTELSTLSTALDNETPVNTTDRVLDTADKKKQTIKSLNIPLNTGSSDSTGLNV